MRGDRARSSSGLAAVASLALVTLGCAAARPAAARSAAPAVVVLYDGLGTVDGASLGGRVLEDKGLDQSRPRESWLRRVKRSWRLLESDEIPHAEVELRVLGRSHRLRADKEGLLSLTLAGPLPAGDHPVSARLLERGRPYRVIEGRLQVWPRARGAASVAVVSDVDDTVLDSQVTSKRKLLWRVLTSNAHQLQTFPGAPALFRALSARGCPIAFVSGSPINLYPRLRLFLQLRGFPRAPLLLKNLGLSRGSDSLLHQQAYKLRRIAELRRLLPGYRLILIGDSGEKDPEIYARVQREQRKLVAAILIHRVTAEQRASARFAGQVLFERYGQAAAELVRLGLLTPPAAAGKGDSRSSAGGAR